MALTKLSEIDLLSAGAAGVSATADESTVSADATLREALSVMMSGCLASAARAR